MKRNGKRKTSRMVLELSAMLMRKMAAVCDYNEVSTISAMLDMSYIMEHVVPVRDTFYYYVGKDGTNITDNPLTDEQTEGYAAYYRFDIVKSVVREYRIKVTAYEKRGDNPEFVEVLNNF